MHSEACQDRLECKCDVRRQETDNSQQTENSGIGLSCSEISLLGHSVLSESLCGLFSLLIYILGILYQNLSSFESAGLCDLFQTVSAKIFDETSRNKILPINPL